MSHVLRFGINLSPTVPVLPLDGVRLRESLPLPPALFGRDLDGDLLVFRDAECVPCDPGAIKSLDGDSNREVERDRPEILGLLDPRSCPVADKSCELESEELLPLPLDLGSVLPCFLDAIVNDVSNLSAKLISFSS